MEAGDRIKSESGHTGTVTKTFDDRAQIAWDDSDTRDKGKFYSMSCLEKI